MSVLEGCRPRPEVLKGDLDDAIFAADFGELIAGKAPAVYQDPVVFFQNTHPAKPLCKVVQAVFERLAKGDEGGATIRLSTGFGGGKTHTLMSLFHLAKGIGDASLGTELLPAAGRPKKVTLAAVDAGKAGTGVFLRHGGVASHSLWGEIGWQLSGEKGLKLLAEADDAERQPDEELIEKLFPTGPALILLDELVIYMATLSDRAQGNLLAFMSKLISVAARRPHTALIVTDPADQRAYAQQAGRLAGSLVASAKEADAFAAAVKLDDQFGRKMSDFDPIGNESERVIVRRLFERVDPTAAQKASATYHALYERVLRETPGSLPPEAATAAYAKRIVDCYPFHPRLIDSATQRLGALQEFNKSRGTLRLFARILRGVWERKEKTDLISAGEIDFASDRIQGDLLQRLNRDNFKAAVSADIEKHARELDSTAGGSVHVRAASALLLESIPMQPSSGLDPAELTLAILRPDEAGHEPAEALDRLIGVCWHTYPLSGGRGWQFRYEPNVIKQIEERMGKVPLEDARDRVKAEVQGYFSGPTFKLTSWPQNARQVPELADIQLVLSDDDRIALSVCANADDTDAAAPIPRRFQNSVFAVTSTRAAFDGAVERAQRLLASDSIEKENKHGEAGKLLREQLQRVKPELHKLFRIQACRAFDRIVLAGGISHPLEEAFQVPDEQILQKPQGQPVLRKFLEAKELVYRAGEALDVDRFMTSVLPGTVPVSGKNEVYTAKAVHERFLASPGLRLIPDGAIVRQTLLAAVDARKIAIRLADGRAYDAKGCVEGLAGARRRTPVTLTTFALDDTVLVAPATGFEAGDWLRVDAPGIVKEGGSGPSDPPPAPTHSTKATATDFTKAAEYAATRPLLELKLTVSTPTAADQLLGLAQPFGADLVRLSVMASGEARDGGTLSFSADDVKPTHPAKPLVIARTVFTSLSEGGSYEAIVGLGFGISGRMGMRDALLAAAERAPEGLLVEALFGAPADPGGAA